jgi:hypothetical protein
MSVLGFELDSAVPRLRIHQLSHENELSVVINFFKNLIGRTLLTLVGKNALRVC